MRLNKIKNLFVVLTLGLSTHSCLDLEPQEQLAETNYWNTPDDYLLFANQICLPIKMNVIYLAMEAMLYSLRMLTIPAITRTSAVRICY